MKIISWNVNGIRAGHNKRFLCRLCKSILEAFCGKIMKYRNEV